MNISTNNNPIIKRSQIFLAAWIAAEKALPEPSLKLIKDHDRLQEAWRKAGWPSPVPTDLHKAGEAIEADPLASIAFRLRQQSNQEAANEYWSEKSGGAK
jgi:hypothetical protein